jgi:hypothetical protein
MFDAIRRLMANGNEKPDHPNPYYPVSDAEITVSESKLGYQLPEQLRNFHRQVGYGFFKSASPQVRGGNYNYINRFLAPSQIADLLLGNDEESTPSEGFGDGEIPFFEVGDRLYLVIRPSPSHPNQVAWPFGDVVSDDLYEFTRRLAANPRFYHG